MPRFVYMAVRDGKPCRLKVCSICGEAKLITDDKASEFSPNTRRADGSIKSYRPQCKPCFSAACKVRRDGRIEMARAIARHNYRKAMRDPVRKKARRAQDAKRQREYRKDPVKRAVMNAHTKAWIQRKRAEDPTYFAEYQRMQYRLQIEREGRKLSTRPVVTGLRGADDLPKLPAEPLAKLLAEHVERAWQGDEHTAQSTLERLGVNERSYREWLTGVRTLVQFNVADRVLTRLGISWDEVWPPHVYPEVAARLMA